MYVLIELRRFPICCLNFLIRPHGEAPDHNPAKSFFKSINQLVADNPPKRCTFHKKVSLACNLTSLGTETVVDGIRTTALLAARLRSRLTEDCSSALAGRMRDWSRDADVSSLRRFSLYSVTA
jgi:hypothetical protein